MIWVCAFWCDFCIWLLKFGLAIWIQTAIGGVGGLFFFLGLKDFPLMVVLLIFTLFFFLIFFGNASGQKNRDTNSGNKKKTR